MPASPGGLALEGPIPFHLIATDAGALKNSGAARGVCCWAPGEAGLKVLVRGDPSRAAATGC